MLQRLNPTPAFDSPKWANDTDPTETAEWLEALEVGRPRISASSATWRPLEPIKLKRK